MENADGTCQLGGHQADRRQAALLDLGLHRARGKNADAGAQFDRLFDHLDIVEVHHNVHFDPARAEEFVERAILDRFGYRIPVVMRTAAELEAVSRGNPFLAKGAEPDTLHVVFLAGVPAASRVAALDPDRSPPDELLARGREIYQHGIAAEGVPACSSCHGADARGTQEYPRLASQHAQYVLKQLASFQSNMRKVAIMHGVAQNLRRPEMESVAAFLEAQP